MKTTTRNIGAEDGFALFLGFLVNNKGFDAFAIIGVVEKPHHFEKEYDAHRKDLEDANMFYLEHGGVAADVRFYSGLDGHADNNFGGFKEAWLYKTLEEAKEANGVVKEEEGFECYIGQLDDYGCFDGTKVHHPE